MKSRTSPSNDRSTRPAGNVPRLVAAASLAAACSLTLPDQGEFFDAYGQGGRVATAGGGSGSDAAGETSAAGSNMAVGGGGETNGSGGASGEQPIQTDAGAGGEGTPPIKLPPAILFIHYTFDDVSSFTAEDSSGNGKDGTLTGLSLPTGEAGHIDGAIRLDATQKQYVQLPGDIMEKFAAISVASWLKLASGVAWDRLFDFNAGEQSWFYFSPTGWNSNTMMIGSRVAILGGGRLDPELMLPQPFPVGDWHHVAVVLSPPYLRYYVDGLLEAELTNMTVKPSDVGKTHQNWLGRSVFATDPYLNGWLDDFRVYSGALTEEQVVELAEE